MDKLINDLIEYESHKINNGNIKNKFLIQFLLNVISICFIYDPIKCLNALQNKNITKEIFIFWFNNLNKLNSKINIKYNLIAICSIIKIDIKQQAQLIINSMKQLIESIFSLTKKINDIINNNFILPNLEFDEFDIFNTLYKKLMEIN